MGGETNTDEQETRNLGEGEGEGGGGEGEGEGEGSSPLQTRWVYRLPYMHHSWKLFVAKQEIGYQQME